MATFFPWWKEIVILWLLSVAWPCTSYLNVMVLQLVLSTGEGVNGFTLDPSLGEFILTHPDIKVYLLCEYWINHVISCSLYLLVQLLTPSDWMWKLLLLQSVEFNQLQNQFFVSIIALKVCSWSSKSIFCTSLSLGASFMSLPMVRS